MKKRMYRGMACFLAVWFCCSLALLSLPVSASAGEALNVTYQDAGVPAGLFSSSLSENRFLYRDENRSLTYRGGWSVGCVTDSGYRAFTYANTSDRNWLTLSTEDQWASPGGTVNRNSLEIHPSGAAGYATAIAYTAATTGVLTVSLDTFSPVAGDGFAVFLGGRMVFPSEGAGVGDAGDVSRFYQMTKSAGVEVMNHLLASVQIPVRRGEVVSFAVKRNSESGKGNTVFSPRITYISREKDTVLSSVMEFGGENFPTYMQDNGYTLRENFRGGWSLGSFPRTGADTFMTFRHVSETFCILNNSGDDQWTYGGLYLQNGIVITAQNCVTAFCYEAPAAGTLQLRLDGYEARRSDAGEDILFCILRGNRMIWPVKGGGFRDYNAWYNLTGEQTVTPDAAALTGISVAAGERFYFCLVARSGHSMTAGRFRLVAEYTEVASSLPTETAMSSVLSSHYPTLASDGNVLSYHGGWQYVTVGGNGEATLLSRAGETGLSAPGGGYLLPTRNGESAAGLCPGTGKLAVRYRAKYSGKVRLSFGVTLPGGDGVFSLTVYRNGAVTGEKSGTAAELAAYATELTLCGGDEILFAVSGGGGEVLYLSPSVTYLSATDLLAVTGASMSPAEGLRVYFYVASYHPYARAGENGLLVYRQEPNRDDPMAGVATVLHAAPQNNNTCRYTYEGISAKEMTDTVYVRPYLDVAGKRVWGEVYRFSVAEYLFSLYGTDALRNRLLSDLLAYGAAAQTYFGYHTERLATAEMNAAQLAAATRDGWIYRQVKSLSDPPQDACEGQFVAVSLLLDAKISLRVYAAYSEEPMYLEVAENPKFSGAKVYRMKNGSACTDPVSAATLHKILYLRLRQGNGSAARYSETLTYSLASYIASVSGGEGAGAALAAKLFSYGQSALAYATRK